MNGTYLGSLFKYYNQLNDCLYLYKSFNRAIHSLSSWILLPKSSSTSQFSLNKGKTYIITPQCQGIIWSTAGPSVQKILFHPTHSPVREGGKDSPCGTTYYSQSRKRQFWQWCLESPYHGLKTTLSKGKKKYVSLTCQLRIKIPKGFCFSAFKFNNHSSVCFLPGLGRTGSQSREYRLFQSAPVQLIIIYTAVYLPAEAWPKQLTLY